MLWCCTPHIGVPRAIVKSVHFNKPREGVLPPTKKQACAQKIDVEAIVDALKAKLAPQYYGKAPSSKEAGAQPVQLSSPQPVAGKRIIFGLNA